MPSVMLRLTWPRRLNLLVQAPGGASLAGVTLYLIHEREFTGRVGRKNRMNKGIAAVLELRLDMSKPLGRPAEKATEFRNLLGFDPS